MFYPESEIVFRAYNVIGASIGLLPNLAILFTPMPVKTSIVL
jgi:hypothetical protein